MGALSPGTHTLKIVADSTGVISESDEGDNGYTKTIVVSAPDLTGEWISPPIQSCRSSLRGESCRITGSLNVSNIGQWKAASSYVDIYLLGVDGDSLIKRISTGILQPGASKTLKLNYSLPLNITATGKSVKGIIDPDNTLQESDETNNTAVSDPIQ
jgi:subtilase family serine protease